MCEYNYKEALERLRQDGFTVLETERRGFEFLWVRLINPH